MKKYLVLILLLSKGMSADAEEPDKSALKFALTTGAQYPLCIDYVEMLNQTKYTDVPVCGVKYLPELDKFKSVKWVKNTDKADIRKMMQENIRLNNLWLVLIEQTASKDDRYKRKADESWRIAKYEMDSGRYPEMSTALVDMDHDGKNETVYRFTRPSAGNAEFGLCAEHRSYLVTHSEPEKTETSYSHPLNDSDGLVAGDADLFYYDGRIYQEYWQGISAQYHLVVNEVSGRPNQVCGINIVHAPK